MTMRLLPGSVSGLGFVALVGACGGGDFELINPPPPPPAGFRVQVRADPEDQATAQTLAWEQGIPDAEVLLRHKGTETAPRLARTNASGLADFGEVPPGDYELEAQRWLSPDERQRLSPADDAVGWVSRETIRPASTTYILSTPASRRKSLVISEWAFNHPSEPNLGSYLFGGYLELHNNADTTVFLDGLIIGDPWTVSANYPSFPCTTYDSFTLDQAGVWSRLFHRFPGTGTDYPVLPGTRVVIATDAIDHRPLYPGTLDLSRADFEFSANPDADNPTVPNLEYIGLVPLPLGHGLHFSGPTPGTFLSLPVDVGSLVRTNSPGSENPWVRFPRDKILEFIAIAPYPNSAGYASCPLYVSPVFDRRPTRARGTDNTDHEHRSLQRRTVPGASILQHTRNSDADFLYGPRRQGNP